eukprot:9478399-Pyramimonas_sp.AAC.1
MSPRGRGRAAPEASAVAAAAAGHAEAAWEAAAAGCEEGQGESPPPLRLHPPEATSVGMCPGSSTLGVFAPCFVPLDSLRVVTGPSITTAVVRRRSWGSVYAAESEASVTGLAMYVPAWGPPEAGVTIAWGA